MRAVIVVAVVLASVPSAQALYDDVELTNMITDAADFAGFYDIRSIDVGEPGDGTILVKFTVEAYSTQAPNACVPAVLTTAACGSVDLFLSNPSGFRKGINGDGTWDSGWENCERDGDSVYCVMTYETLGVGVGGTLSGPYAISYYTAAQDYAPGGTFAQSLVSSGTGTDYKLTGCTLVDPAACFGGTDAAPVTVYADLQASAVSAVFENATSDDHVYNFTNDLPAAVATFDVNGTGFANATLIDGNGTELFNGTAETGTIDLGNVTTGDWQLLVDFTDFNGTFGFELVSPETAAENAGGTDGTTTEGGTEGVAGTDGNATGNETLDGTDAGQEAPGPALPLLSIGLGAAAFALRRRR